MPRHCLRLSRAFACLALSTILAACGGGGSGNDNPGGGLPPPPPTTPTAAFTSAATATAQAPVAFDGSGSASADGSALSYSWDFGDGTRGGGARIAHAFAKAGAASVKLTVIDGAGRSGSTTQPITVAAAAAATGAVVVHLAVADAAGTAVAAVAITRAGTTDTLGTTDASGLADVTLDRGTPFALRLVKGGYADQILPVNLPATTGTNARLTAVLHARDAAQTLADAHAGGTLIGRDGATITLPPDALLTAGGALATGAVPISMTAVDPTLTAGGGFPGTFTGVEADASAAPIASFGTVEFVLGDPAARMNLAPGKTATVELPLYALRQFDGTTLAAGDAIPLWSLDDNTGLWVQEGTGIVVTSATSPSGFAMRATVSHFSWWNSDYRFKFYPPEPYCIPDPDFEGDVDYDQFGEGATICNFEGDIVYGSGSPESTRRMRVAALTPSEKYAGFSATIVAKAGAGQTQYLPLPPGLDSQISVTALNGTWVGSVVVNGQAGVGAPVMIKMHPVHVTGPAPEAVTMPFDITRGTQPAQVGRFTFAATTTGQYARLRADPAVGTTQSGTLRLLQGTTVLSTATYSAAAEGVVLYALPTTGTYMIEVQADQTGTTRLRGELLGGAQTASLPFPADTTVSVPVYASYSGGFDVSAPAALHLAALVTNGNSKGELRVFAPDGSVLWSSSGQNYNTASYADILLPGAGRYTFFATTSDGSALELELQTAPISWGQQGAAQQVYDLFSMADLVADRNGKPVMGFVRQPQVGQVRTAELLLRRFTGSTWEDVGPVITLPQPCNAPAHQYSFAFDSTNTPTVAYATSSPSPDYGYFVVVRKLVGGAWQGVGSNGGVLPGANLVMDGNGYCNDRIPPRVVIDAADRPVVAYQGAESGPLSRVQRFDGNAWGPLASGSDDRFTGTFTHDLAVGPDGTLWFSQTSFGDNSMQVRRFDTAAANWVFAGPNSGKLPETGTDGWSFHRIRFDSAGRPVVGGMIGILDSTGATSSTGVAVYRFNGTTWSTTGGYQLPDSYINQLYAAFAMSGDTAYMAFFNQYRDDSASSNTLVQKNTPAGWTPVGVGTDGSLNGYLASGGFTPAASRRNTGDARIVVVGSDVYLAVTRATPPSTGGADTVVEAVLLKLAR
jgi:hypothetical protein